MSWTKISHFISVKLWSINAENSIACLEAKANVCCVKFNPESRYHLAFGSAGKIKTIGSVDTVPSICTCIWSFLLLCLSNSFCFFLIDHFVHYYDLRNTKEAVMVFKGHRKAVSYTKFLNTTEIVSA